MTISSRYHQLVAIGRRSPAEPLATATAAPAATVCQEEQQQQALKSHETASTSGKSVPEVGYKYGYRPPPAFECVSQWEPRRSLEDRLYTPRPARRPKTEAEREITRQLPLWQPVELGLTWRETHTDGGPPPSGADCEPTSYVNPQRESKFVSLLSEDIRYAIYDDCLALPAGKARWSFSPLNYKARYEDEHGVAYPQERSRTALLLCCRQLYLEVRPCLLRLLRNATMISLAPRFLPWSMPFSNLACIRSLSWHFFFDCHLGIYVPSILAIDEYQAVRQLRICTSSFEYAAAWDIVLAHMPSLRELRFRGYLRLPMGPSSTTAIFAIHELKLLEPLKRAQEARRNGGHHAKLYSTTNLDRLLLELYWPSRHDRHAEWQAMLKRQWREFLTTLYRNAKFERGKREMLQNTANIRDVPRRSRGLRISDARGVQEGAEDTETGRDEDAHILLSQPEARSLTDILAAPGCEVVVKHLFARRLHDPQERECGQVVKWHLDPAYVEKLEAGMREIRPYSGEESLVTAWNVEGA